MRIFSRRAPQRHQTTPAPTLGQGARGVAAESDTSGLYSRSKEKKHSVYVREVWNMKMVIFYLFLNISVILVCSIVT